MMKKRGLGKSLDALLVGSYSATSENAKTPKPEPASDSLAQLTMDLIQPGKYQPRRIIDPQALEELAASIRAQGVIQPIVVRKINSGKYEIIAGERRWRAAQLAGLTEMPAIIRQVPDEAAVAIALIENIQRENLNPIEEAYALQRLLDEFAMTHQQVAEAVGKSRATVTNLLRLLSLNESVRILVEQGDIEMGHARALLTLTEALQIEAAETVIAKGLSVRETEELVRKLQVPVSMKQSDSKTIDPDLKRLQQELTHKLHMKVAIKCNAKGKGKLVIEYENLTELDSLLEFFQ
jgi:ParB family transcriptional regulator, chromosome partitioning protein